MQTNATRRVLCPILLMTMIACVIVGLSRPLAVAAQQATASPDPSARITAPSDGSPLFGSVAIVGTAANSQFQSYRLDYLAQIDPGGQFQPISRQVNQQVTNAILGQWDTTQVKDGLYQIRMRVILRNGTVLENFVRDLRVQNTQPTALPTQPPPLPTQPPPTAGASPTALIQQPPTATARPPTQAPILTLTRPAVQTGAPTVTIPAAIGGANNDAGNTGDPARGTPGGGTIQSALCNGAILAIIGFGLYAAYGWLRARARRTAR